MSGHPCCWPMIVLPHEHDSPSRFEGIPTEAYVVEHGPDGKCFVCLACGFRSQPEKGFAGHLRAHFPAPAAVEEATDLENPRLAVPVSSAPISPRRSGSKGAVCPRCGKAYSGKAAVDYHLQKSKAHRETTS